MINVIKASRILRHISNENRLKILLVLYGNSMSVSILNEHVKISQPSLSQHLNILKLANIVDSKRKGIHVIYSIVNKDIINILSLLQNNVLMHDN